MKEIEVQTENKDKEIVKSSKINIDEDSDRIKVIVSVSGTNKNSPPSMKDVQTVHSFIVEAIKNGNKIITIPDWVKINTIKI